MWASKFWNPWVLFTCLWIKFTMSTKNILILLLLLEFIMVLSFVAGSFSVIHGYSSLKLVVYLSVLMVGESLLGMSMLIKFSRSHSKEQYIV
uniref:NADH dehydrogenase subunit 4L n=1 Tax=Tigriopus japonicus TaxID=158387 RepID=Q8M6U1_TIGJA|nr:NADH dehydrogenase subunit 4L [Tigriopus japonicus]